MQKPTLCKNIKSDFFKRMRTVWVTILMVFVLSLVGCSSSNMASASSETDPSNTDVASTSVAAEKLPGVPAEKYTDEQDGLATSNSEADGDGQSSLTSNETITVRFLNIGQGDSALITCNGQNMLIDGGPSSASSMVYSVLNRLGITHLDYIIATHPDADHCSGIAGALNYADCDRFYCSVSDHDTKTFKSILKYLGTTPVTIPHYGDTFMLGEAKVQFVGPVMPTPDSNNGSLVCLLTYGNTRFLFTGDAETESEASMLSAGADLDADVLKVGHHGSDSSSSLSFINKVSPKYAVISVGKNNYGHPADAVITRLQQTGAEILRTDELGSIIFESDGLNLRVSNTKGLIEK